MEGAEFFEQLGEFSERYVSQVGMTSSLSPWGYDEYDKGLSGAILHFTADEDFHRVLRWFLREKYQSRSSAHVVVADSLMPKHEEHAKGLPLIEELPVTVVQCRPHDKAAWHATWTNDRTYGIENVCAGELRSAQGAFYTWRPRDQSAPEWTAPWEPRIQKEAVPLHGRWWSPYPPEQIEANVTILRHLASFYDLKRPWILGHEAVQGTYTGRKPTDKRDPGPTFPIHGVREAVFNDWVPLSRLAWFQNYKADIFWGQTWRDGALIDWARWKAGDESINPEPKVAMTRFQTHLDSWAKDAGVPFGRTGRVAMYLLGYYMRDDDLLLDSDENQSVRIFQRMMGLKADGTPGARTRAALIERLEDRGIFDVPEVLS